MARNDREPWLLGGTAAVVAVIAGLLIWSNLGREEPSGRAVSAGSEPTARAAKLFDPARPPAELRYLQARLVPAGAPVALAPDTLAVAGTTEEGYLLYTTVPGGGGGGPATAPQRLFVRTTDGRYQPLAWR